MSESITEEQASDSSYKQIYIGPKTVHIPDDWGTANLSDIAQDGKKSFIDGDWVESEDMVQDGPYQLIQLGNIGEGHFKGECDKYVSEEFFQEKNCTLVEEGDLLISRLADPVLRTIIVPEFEKKSITAVDIVVAKVDETEWSKEYIWQLLNSKPLADAGNSLATGSTRQRISRSNMSKITIPRPPLPEQRRIADILSTVDEQIQQTDEIIETTKELRHGLRQDLVFGKSFADDYKSVRLGARNVEIPSGWEVATFSDVAAVEKGNTPKTSNSDYYGGDIVWVTPDDLSNMYERGEKYISDSRRKITDAGLQSTSVNIVPAPSVMFTSRSYGIGKTAICTVPAATNQGIIGFHPRKQIGVEYLYYYLNQIMDYIIAISGVSNFPEVSLTDIRNLRVPVPSKDDQECIESVLQLVDERLVEEQNTKRHLHEFKRGLMQDLLTGKVRVNTD